MRLNLSPTIPKKVTGIFDSIYKKVNNPRLIRSIGSISCLISLHQFSFNLFNGGKA